MLQLRTFGGLTLARGEEDLTGAVTQRRRRAILALVAVARQAGRSALGHVLNQLLYAQRRQFEEDGLFLGRKTLRLNPAVIWTDVASFEQALDDGATQEGIALVRGPFLDGFFVKLGALHGFSLDLKWSYPAREREPAPRWSILGQ